VIPTDIDILPQITLLLQGLVSIS